jgi:hypothetical protein
MTSVAQHWLPMALLLMPLLMISALVGNAWHILRSIDVDPADMEME